MPRLFHCIADHLADKVVGSGVGQTSDLRIAETVIDKCGMPPAASFIAIGIIAVGAVGVT